jgi:hypothetical protein
MNTKTLVRNVALASLVATILCFAWSEIKSRYDAAAAHAEDQAFTECWDRASALVDNLRKTVGDASKVETVVSAMCMNSALIAKLRFETYNTPISLVFASTKEKDVQP